MPLCVEGLDIARRSMDHAKISWIGQNVADLLSFEGRIEEALAYAEEAIANAGSVGDQQRLANCLAQRAFVRLERGDRTAARSDVDESRRISGVPEPQSVIYEALFDALFLWPDDPSAACTTITDALRSTGAAPASLVDSAPTAARMALRLGDGPRLAASVAAFVAVAERCSGPVRALQRRWLDALRIGGDPSAVAALRAVAGEFEAIEYRLPAADCHADAALSAMRAGLDPTDDEEDARRLYAACGAVPLLGDLPERRWIATAETSRAIANG
jgi:hypothetical protein